MLLSIAAFLFTCSMAFTQNTNLDNFISKYKNEPGFSFAFLSKDLFEVAVQSEVKDADWKKMQQVVSNIGSLSVLVADSLDQAPSLYKEALSAVPADEFDELLTVQDGKDRVRVWVRNEEAVLTDLVLLVGTSDEFVLVCFSGNLELNNLSALAALFDAESAEQLTQTSQAVAAVFSINPNPSTGRFSLEYAEQDDAPDQMIILDQNGRQLLLKNLDAVSSQTVSVTELPSGIYWVQLKTKKGKVGVKQLQIMKMP